MEFRIIYAVALPLLVLHVTHTIALRCYTCSYVATGDGNKACIEDPAGLEGGQKITNCNKKFCTIQRQELTNRRGYINSFLRGCEDKPINDVFEDPTFKTYFRSCNTDLCNSGDGIRSSGLAAQADGDYGPNMIVPGLTSSGSRSTGRSTVNVSAALRLLLPAATSLLPSLARRQLLLL